MDYERPGIEQCCTICDQRENLVFMDRGITLYPIAFCRTCADDVIAWAKKQTTSRVARTAFGN